MQVFLGKIVACAMISSCCFLLLLPSVEGYSLQGFNKFPSPKNLEDKNAKLNDQKKSDIEVHGVLLWLSLGFLMPAGILTIRMSAREGPGSRRLKFLFYLHVILQTLSVLLATAGAVMSIKKFENSFSNNHQRIGLALYIAIWVQALIGIFRPHRGRKERTVWYLVHWILGTAISLAGIINIYTGLNAFHKKTLRSTGLWTILFTAEISFLGFFYLFQDKWVYMQKQGAILGTTNPITSSEHPHHQEQATQKDILPAQPCGKRNALMNLFD